MKAYTFGGRLDKIAGCRLHLPGSEERRVEAALKLQPVGEEWDGSVKPIGEVKYPPGLEPDGTHV